MLDIARRQRRVRVADLRDASVTVVGVDIAEAVVRQRLDDELLPFNVVGDMEALPFPDGAFDAALALACLHHMPDPVPRSPRRSACCGRAGGCSRSTRTRCARAVRGRCRSRASRTSSASRCGGSPGRCARAGFEVEEVRGRGLSMRAVAKVVREPSLRLYHAGDAVDRVLRVVPGLESLSERGMIRARKPA